MEEIKTIVEAVKAKIRENILEESKQKGKRFFISDLHFQDERLNLYFRDELFKNAKEVDEHIVEMWNKTVDKGDLVIVGGDVSMTLDGLENLKKCNGEKWLVRGNYDINVNDESGIGTAKYDVDEKVLSKYFTKIVDELDVEIGGEKFYVNHFPVNAKADVFNICGHIHKLFQCQRHILNISADQNNFIPLSESKILFLKNAVEKFYDSNVFSGELKVNVENRKGEVIVLRAPEEYKFVDSDENKSVFVFLAGCIQGTDSKKMWQEEIIKKIQDQLKNIKTNKNVVLCSPRRLEKPKNFIYEEQVDWEEKYLLKSSTNGIVVFWLGKEVEKIEGRSFCQTSRFELGWIFERQKNAKDFNIIIGTHEKFEGARYIKYKFEQTRPEFEMKSSVGDIVEETVRLIKTML